MIRFAPFHPSHLAGLALQPAQDEALRQIADPAYAAMLRDKGFALTAFSEPPAENGGGVRHVVGSAGILPQWTGRAVAWVLMGPARPADWTAIVRRMASAIDAAHRAGVRRIEATCDCGFAPGNRLLKLLGFAVEGRLAAYSPVGRDHFLYARIQESDR